MGTQATYMGDAMRRRGRLVPFLASALRAFERTAVSPIRGLYIDHPTAAHAYSYNDTFTYCDAMVVAPVTHNVSNSKWHWGRGMWHWGVWYVALGGVVCGIGGVVGPG